MLFAQKHEMYGLQFIECIERDTMCGPHVDKLKLSAGSTREDSLTLGLKRRNIPFITEVDLR